MRIPTVEPSVSVQVPNVSQVQVPGAIGEAAFGGNVASATARAGQEVAGTGEQATNVGLQMLRQQNEVHLVSLENQFREHNDNLLYNPDQNATKTIKDRNGNDMIVPASIMGRFENQAHGATKDYDSNISSVVDSTLSQVKNPMYRAELANRIHQVRLSTREEVIRHEVGQIKTADMREYTTNNTNLINSAAADPNKLPLILNNIAQRHKEMGFRFGQSPDEVLKGTEEDQAKAVTKAGFAMLNSGATLDEVHTFLESKDLSGKIPPDYQEEIDFKLDRRNHYIEQITKKQQAETEFTQTASVVKGIASGKINLNDSNIDVVALAGSNIKLGIAIKAVQADKGEYTIQDNKNEVFQEYVKDIFAAKSKEKINDLLIDALNANGNKEINQDKLNIIVDAAMNQAKNIPIRDGDEPPPISPQELEKIAGFHYITNWNENNGIKDPHAIAQYLTEVNKNIPASVAVSNAVRTTAIKNNPEILRVPEKGQLMIDKNGNKAMVFPDGHFEEIKKEKTNAI